MNTHHARHMQGFTIIELVLTIVITATLAAIAIPRFFTTTAFDQRGFNDEVINALRYAQSYAQRTRCNTRVQITTSGYQLFRPANRVSCQSMNSGDFTTALSHPVNTTIAFAGSAPSGITLSVHNIIYTSLGSANTSQDISVGSATIRVEATTGYTHSL